MRIGLTYDLRSTYLASGWDAEMAAEFDREDTIDAIETALRRLGHQTERIGHIRDLVRSLAAGRRWDLVFNICEGAFGLAREAQVPALLEAYGIPYTFSDPLVMALCLDKGRAKVLVRAAGVPTPQAWVVDHLAAIPREPLPLPLFVKPLAEGTGKGITSENIIERPEQLPPLCHRILEKFRQPALIETYLPGREFTVGIVGTGKDARVLGTLEIRLRAGAENGVYSYHNKEYCERLVEYVLADSNEPVVATAERLALQAWRALGCRDAGRIDLRCDACGNPQFLEANPLAGLHPEHSDLPMLCTALGISYEELLGWIIDSAMRRIPEAASMRHALDLLDTPCASTGIA